MFSKNTFTKSITTGENESKKQQKKLTKLFEKKTCRNDLDRKEGGV